MSDDYKYLGEMPAGDTHKLKVNYDQLVTFSFTSITKKMIEELVAAIVCKRCGTCCTIEGPGAWASDEDILNISNKLGLRPRQFRRRYCHLVDGKWHLVFPCKFYSRGAKKGCAIYDVRPFSCRVYPVYVLPDLHMDTKPCVAIRQCPAGLELIKELASSLQRSAS